jgi:hypothetical protein
MSVLLICVQLGLHLRWRQWASLKFWYLYWLARHPTPEGWGIFITILVRTSSLGLYRNGYENIFCPHLLTYFPPNFVVNSRITSTVKLYIIFWLPRVIIKGFSLSQRNSNIKLADDWWIHYPKVIHPLYVLFILILEITVNIQYSAMVF